MPISYTELRARVKARLPEKRFRHSERVAAFSAELAERFSLDPAIASYIGIYHDAYRYQCNEDTPSLCRMHGIEVFPEEEREPMLLHGALAAMHFDEDAEGPVPGFFKAAVRHHTLGSRDMGIYGAVLYIADYAEPGRKHLDERDRALILSAPSLERMIILIMDMQRDYFDREGIKEASVSEELYSLLRAGSVFSPEAL